jgi:hypothetical protein
MVVYTCKPGTWEAEAELQVQGQPDVHSEIYLWKQKTNQSKEKLN